MKHRREKSNKRHDKKRKESRIFRHTRIILWKLFTRFKCRERIAKANAWADRHRRKTAGYTIATLLFLLIIGTVSSLTDLRGQKQEQNIMEDIEQVGSMFKGLQRIQDAKTYHVSQLDGLAMRGQAIKHELDSLVRLPFKTKKDSTEIIVRYRQLEMIVRNLKNSK